MTGAAQRGNPAANRGKPGTAGGTRGRRRGRRASLRARRAAASTPASGAVHFSCSETASRISRAVLAKYMEKSASTRNTGERKMTRYRFGKRVAVLVLVRLLFQERAVESSLSAVPIDTASVLRFLPERRKELRISRWTQVRLPLGRAKHFFSLLR